MSDQKYFQKLFHDSRVTSICIGGEVLYHALQMGEKLGISASVVRKAVWKMTDDKRLLVTKSMLCRYAHENSCLIKIPSNRGQYYLRKPGVYELVFRSRSPEAEEFTDWLCEEVIPSIVRRGGYHLDESTKSKSEEEPQEDPVGFDEAAYRQGSDAQAVFSFLRTFGFNIG